MNVELKEVEEGFVKLTITPVKPRERLRDRNHVRATAPVSEVASHICNCISGVLERSILSQPSCFAVSGDVCCIQIKTAISAFVLL